MEIYWESLPWNLTLMKGKNQIPFLDRETDVPGMTSPDWALSQCKWAEVTWS